MDEQSDVDEHTDLPRPGQVRSWTERTVEWAGWFGVGRLVAAALSTVVVCAGAYWLVRSPPPASEAALPRAVPSTSIDSVAGSGGAMPGEPPPAAPSSSVAPTVVVHVAGAVAQPGVVVLGAGARVLDAVDAAGGGTAAADLDALNLAGTIPDGSRVYVPEIGEVPPPELNVSPGGGEVSPASPVDVNRATTDELEALPGVGPATAGAIVEDRLRNGPFVGVDDLERVPGIGPAKIAALRDLVAT